MRARLDDDPGTHASALDAHNINADVATGLAIVAAVYGLIALRDAAPVLVIASVVLAILMIALTAIGHAITGSGHHGLTPVHVPLALLAFGLTIWLSARVTALRKTTAG